MLSLILQENSFRFNGSDYLQTHGTAMGTKMAVAIANIFMAKIERQILRQSSKKRGFTIGFSDPVIPPFLPVNPAIPPFFTSKSRSRLIF